MNRTSHSDTKLQQCGAELHSVMERMLGEPLSDFVVTLMRDGSIYCSIYSKREDGEIVPQPVI